MRGLVGLAQKSSASGEVAFRDICLTRGNDQSHGGHRFLTTRANRRPSMEPGI
jgi:hypothetical protein